MRIDSTIHSIYPKLLTNVLRFNYFLWNYRTPLLTGSASFFAVFVIGSAFDMSLNPLRGPAPASNFVIGIAFLLLWLFSSKEASSLISIRLRKVRAKHRSVAIYALRGYDDGAYRRSPYLKGTRFTPLEWKRLLESQSFKCELIMDSDRLEEFSIVLNTFGELYLEEDLGNQRSFRKIKEYIKYGGLFVNIGGLAFYYALNPTDPGVEMLTGPLIETSEVKNIGGHLVLFPLQLPEDSSFVDTFLLKEFGVRTTLAEFGAGYSSGKVSTYDYAVDRRFSDLQKPKFDVHDFRAAIRSENPSNELIPILRHRYYYSSREMPGTPARAIREAFTISAVSHGAGYLLLFGMPIPDEKASAYAVQCIEIVSKKLKTEGRL